MESVQALKVETIFGETAHRALEVAQIDSFRVWACCEWRSNSPHL